MVYERRSRFLCIENELLGNFFDVQLVPICRRKITLCIGVAFKMVSVIFRRHKAWLRIVRGVTIPDILRLYIMHRDNRIGILAAADPTFGYPQQDPFSLSGPTPKIVRRSRTDVRFPQHTR